MNRDSKEYTIWNAVTPKAITSSTDATPIVVTATSHGFATNDLVMIFGHTTNVAANGVYRVVRVDANSFQLKDKDSGASIAGSAGGAGSGGIAIAAPKIPFVQDFQHAILSFVTAGTATLTIKVAGSIGKLDGSCPNFGATQSASNPYNFIQVINLMDGGTVNGDTGLAVTGTDFNRTYEININALKYLTLIPTAFTQGNVTAKLQVFNNR